MEPKTFSSENIENKMVTLNYETVSYEDCFETKLQAKCDESDIFLKQPEEEFVDFVEQQHQESEQIEEKVVTLNSKTSCLSEATEVFNEISVKIPSQFLITKITTSFNKNFD